MKIRIAPSSEGIRSIAEVSACERVARSLIVGFDLCESDGRALTQLQKIAFLQATLQVFSDFRSELDSLTAVEEELRWLTGGNGYR